ncbi:MAG TPA: spore germination protein GerW family protein [Actinomycetota bacterium]|nr:spore germination protein GerW family protein [Actinomycetota bacterium]
MTDTDVRETIRQATDVMTVKRVFGEPYERNGVTVIPAARVQGGAGGGEGEGPNGEGKGRGSGYGLNAKPTGVYVIRGDEVVWRPAVDVNRVILGAQLVAIAAILLVRTVVKFRAAASIAELKARH